ncbi:N-acetylmuramoyl-L-alanine amidase [Pseudonocardia sp. N23]|uniref:N-acetylmuramoyl-L-alanine amidase n=1 Tax=Pseudonocardia sp. N23 TaxID=1987376 RepID=UPI000BFD2820|nr:N-acetylmuramoyl-L-alanine amidase [Pseudonocardia sp. N23]GAY12026.1 phage endolysin [Pseudonocardia sp. N23]
MSGIYVPWLADAARLTGYPVAEVSGWRNRGHGGMTAVEGVVCHHTAGPRTGEYPSLQVVRDGHAGLPGPLAHLGLGRSGTVYVIAAGLSYHAGDSGWAGLSSLNYRFIGIEAESTGAGSGDWTPEQVDCYPRLVAALLYFMRRNASRVCAHRECAIPKGRKIDPTGIDMTAFRGRVAALLADPLHRIPRGGASGAGPAPTLRPEDDVMYIKSDLGKGVTGTALLAGPIFVGLTGGEVASADEQIAKGAPVQWVGLATWNELDRRSHALCDNPRPVRVVADPIEVQP